MYVLEGDRARVKAGELKPSPLTLHVNVGDCVKINLKNEMAKERAGFHVDMMAFDPKDSFGANVGNNPGDQTIGTGPEPHVHLLCASAVRRIGCHDSGLGQRGGESTERPVRVHHHRAEGLDLSGSDHWRRLDDARAAGAPTCIVDRALPGNENRKNYRSFSLMFQDEDNILGVSFMPYLQQNAGITAVNYRSEPTAYRIDKGCEVAKMFSCTKAGDLPATPVLAAHVGDPVAIHVLGVFSEQVQLFTLDGHEWPHEPYMVGADQVSTMEFGGSEVINAYLTGGQVDQTGWSETICGKTSGRPYACRPVGPLQGPPGRR